MTQYGFRGADNKKSVQAPAAGASPQAEKTTYEFEIAGMPFKLKSIHDEQVVKELVDFVDQRIRQAMAATKSGSFQSSAVLACLNVAEELILLKKKACKDLDLLDEKLSRLTTELESSKKSLRAKKEAGKEMEESWTKDPAATL